MKLLLRLSLAAALSCAALPAIAAPEDATTTMRAHFERGVKYIEAKPPDYEHALEEFRIAQAAKPSPLILRNIALCLRELGRHLESVEALEQMLAAGDGLTPEVRDGAKAMIAELGTHIGTVHIRVFSGGAPFTKGTVSIDGIDVPPAKLASVRVSAGQHVFRARADGHAVDQQTVVVNGGEDRTISLDMVPIVIRSRGAVQVRANAADAQLTIDGGPPLKTKGGVWSGEIDPGHHTLHLEAPGYESVDRGVDVREGELSDVPVTLVHPIPVLVRPGENHTPVKEPPTRFFIAGGAAYQFSGLRLSSAFDEPSEGTSRSFTGPALALRFGMRISPSWSWGIVGELGRYKSESYGSPRDTQIAADTQLINWVLAPEVRFQTTGKARFVGGLGLGIEGHILKSTLAQGGTALSKDVSASGAGLMFLLEAGFQFDLRPSIYVEGVLFLDVHGLTDVETDSGEAAFASDRGVRGGARAMLGYRF